MLQRILQRKIISFQSGNHAKLLKTPITFSIAKKIHLSSDSINPGCKFAVLSLYYLEKIQNVNDITSKVKDWLQSVGATGRFQINGQGVNCQLCFKSISDVEKFRALLGSCLDVDKEDLSPKVHLSEFNVFKKLRIKQKLVQYLDDTADISERGEHLDRDDWNKMLDSDPNALVLDIRNSYEWDVGRFKQAERPKCRKFNQFPGLVQEVVEKVNNSEEGKEKKVMMYCTGGIRCEVFSNLLIKEGIKNVYQLKDGVLGYGSGSEEDSRHWEGNLFVFDDRMVVPIDGVVGGDKDDPVSVCKFCSEVTHMVYNCNSLQCHVVFVCCMACAEVMQGFCSEHCKSITPAEHGFAARNSRQWKGKLIGRGAYFRELVDKLEDDDNKDRDINDEDINKVVN